MKRLFYHIAFSMVDHVMLSYALRGSSLKILKAARRLANHSSGEEEQESFHKKQIQLCAIRFYLFVKKMARGGERRSSPSVLKPVSWYWEEKLRRPLQSIMEVCESMLEENEGEETNQEIEALLLTILIEAKDMLEQIDRKHDFLNREPCLA